MMKKALQCCGAAASIWLSSCESKPHPKVLHGTALPSLPPPAMNLVDQNDRPFSLAHLRGTTVLVFFGYTHCRDECPVALANLAATRRALPAHERKRLHVLFVTVDPEHDSPAVLARYVKHFDSSFTGLTGSRRQLAAAYRTFNVRSDSAEQRPGERVFHSSAIYLIDPAGRLRELFDATSAPEKIGADVRLWDSLRAHAVDHARKT
jgi:protein SCO1/2